MECNREEAEECIRIAAQALREFKAQRAKNFLNKAERLYPSQQAKGNFDGVAVICNYMKTVDERK